jgi:hypothetical protein
MRFPEMPRDKHLIFHSMVADQIAPIRIILGYGGYSTEYGLREGFLQYLGRNLNVLGFGPPSVPNLIVAGKASLVKLSGHPYHAQLLPNGRWPPPSSESSDDDYFRAIASSAGLDRNAFIKSLTDTTLIARQGSILKLTTIVCRCLVLPDGRFVAADDNSGRLTRWLSRYLTCSRPSLRSILELEWDESGMLMSGLRPKAVRGGPGHLSQHGVGAHRLCG